MPNQRDTVTPTLIKDINAMKSIILSMVLLSPFASAVECTADNQYLQANYKVSEQTSQKLPKNELSFTLWRTPRQVAQQSEQLVELWRQLSNQQIRPIRYFTQAKRGIEYQPSEVKGRLDFSGKYQLVSDQFLAKMQLQSEQGEGCYKKQRYHLKQADTVIELVWLSNQRLVESMQVNKTNYSRIITLQSVSFNKQNVLEQFASWDKYQTTDYADIGDNESDPFLAKMINLGFVEHGATGFYDTNGKTLKSNHHHH